MHLIQNKQTQDRYVNDLTVPPMGWAAVEVIVENAGCIMQTLDKRGQPLDEVVVGKGTLSLDGAGGVRFRTNPATPTAPATIDAYAYRPGEPAIRGLRPRDQPNIFGPALFEGAVGCSAGAGLQKLFGAAPADNTWSAIFLRLAPQELAGTAEWHFRVEWLHGENGLQVATHDFYVYDDFTIAANTPPTIVIPVLGEWLNLYARQTSGSKQDVFVMAYATNLAPGAAWQSPTHPYMLFAQPTVAASGFVDLKLPLYAGPLSMAIGTGQDASGMVLVVSGTDEAGTLLTRPIQDRPFPSRSFSEAAVVGPHRNSIRLRNDGAFNVDCVVSVFAG